MTKPRPIASVHVDIARLAWEVANYSRESTESMESLGQWTLRLVECLVKRDPSIHAYGAHLLAEVEEFRKADSERKKAFNSKDSKDSADSPESPPRSDQIRSDQIKKEERVPATPVGTPRAKAKPEFAHNSIAYEAAKFFWEYVHDWSPQAIEPTESGYQNWARDCDLMFRKDGRTPEAFNELMDWIDTRPESRDGFSWRKNVLCPATLRKRWNEGKFADFLPSDLAKEELK